MRLLITLLIICISLQAIAEEIKWDETSTVKADINCDGTPDIAKLGYFDKQVRLSVTIDPDGPSQFIDFGLGMPGYQNALCGTDPVLTIEVMDYDLVEVFGENPEGFKQSKTCKGLNVRAGECDSMHIFWNHETNHINWWRL